MPTTRNEETLDGRKDPAVPQSQSERFIEAARAAGASEDEAVFDANLRQIVKSKTDSGPKPQAKARAPKK